MKINNKGFTLIELVVVLVIMSLIASIALPNVVKIQSSAKTQVDKANRQTLLNAAKIYYIDNTVTSDIDWDKSSSEWKEYLDKWPEYPLDKEVEYTVLIKKDGEVLIEPEIKEKLNE